MQPPHPLLAHALRVEDQRAFDGLIPIRKSTPAESWLKPYHPISSC